MTSAGVTTCCSPSDSDSVNAASVYELYPVG